MSRLNMRIGNSILIGFYLLTRKPKLEYLGWNYLTQHQDIALVRKLSTLAQLGTNKLKILRETGCGQR